MNTKRRAGPLIVTLIVLAIALSPPTYLLSIGPANWLRWNSYLDPAIYNGYIAPAEFVSLGCRPINDAMVHYVALFSNKHWRN